MSGKQWIILMAIVILGGVVLLFVMKGVGMGKSVDTEGDWICQSGKWIKFGETNKPRPLTACY